MVTDHTDVRTKRHISFMLQMGWSGGAMVLGDLPGPGRPINLD